MPGQSGNAAPFNAKYILTELTPELPNAQLLSSVQPGAHASTHYPAGADDISSKYVDKDANGNVTLPAALSVLNANVNVNTITFDGFTLKAG